jgi:lysophospholipase L1-like esterase
VRILHLGDSHVARRLPGRRAVDSAARGVTARSAGPALLVLRTDGRLARLGGQRWEAGELAYTSLGLNGAQSSVLVSADGSLETGLLRERPDVLVLAFGTNESGSRDFDPAVYESGLNALYARITRALPDAGVLVCGPPDRSGGRVLAEVVEAQRRAARRAGFAFLDLRAEMGGRRSIHSWQGSGLARADLVHFSASGYSELALFVARALSNEARRSGGPVLSVARATPPRTPATHVASTRTSTPDGNDVRVFRDSSGRIIFSNAGRPAAAPLLARRP